MATEDDFRAIRESLNSGDISSLPKARLEQFAVALCHPHAFAFFGNNQFPQICETVRLHLLRAHIDSLQKHITDLNAKNTSLQKWVIALAAAALISSGVQIWLQLSGQSTSAAQALRHKLPPTAAPTPEKPLSSGQATVQRS